METKKVLVILGLAGFLVFSLLAVAGDLEPNEPPAPTMKTLDEIYDAAASVSQREGYMEQVEVDPNNPHTFFTVPSGKRFVLLKLYLEAGYPFITSSGGLYIDNTYFPYGYGSDPVDFQDRCVTVNSGESLTASSSGDPRSWKVTVLGYFYDVE